MWGNDNFIKYAIAVVWTMLIAASLGVLFFVPIEDETMKVFLNGGAMLVLIAFTVPFWILKIGFHMAHRNNYRQSEFEVEDLPKNARDAAKLDERKNLRF